MTEAQRQIANVVGPVVGAGTGGYIASEVTKNMSNDAARTGIIIASGLVGAYIGHKFVEALSEKDQEKLLEAQQQAATSGETVTFEGEPGVTGQVSVVKNHPAKTVPVKVLKDKVDEMPPLEMVDSTYSANNVMNVRSGPSTDYRTVGSLNSGQAVHVIGKVRGQEWFFISQSENGAGNGFVYSPLMSPAEEPVNYVETSQTDLVEMQIPSSQPCKTVRQEVTTSTETIKEDIRVCQQENGSWKLV
jgi:uncharacterized protein YraI